MAFPDDTPKIDRQPAASGRVLREDSTFVNVGDALAPSSIKDVLSGTVDTTGKALDNVACSMVRIYNLDASITIYWGKTGKVLVPILPGLDSGWIPIANANLINIKSASGTPSYVVPCL